MAKRDERALGVIWRHFRAHGTAPSYRQIAFPIGMLPQHVGATLARLQRRGFLTFRKGQAQSIALARRLANFSDQELLLECHARGIAVPAAQPGASALQQRLTDAFAMPVTDYGTDAPPDLAYLLSRLDDEGTNGAGTTEQGGEQAEAGGRGEGADAGRADRAADA